MANETPNRSAISSTLSEPDSTVLQQLQNLLPPPRAADIPPPRDEVVVASASSMAGPGTLLVAV